MGNSGEPFLPCNASYLCEIRFSISMVILTIINRPVFTPGSTGTGGNTGVGVNQAQVLFLRLRLMVEEYSTLRNYAVHLYKATEELNRNQQQRDRGNGVSGEGAFWDGMERIRRLGPVPALPAPLESLVAMPDLQIHTGQVSGVGTMGLGVELIGESGSPGSGVKRRRRSSELHGESTLEDGDRREDVSSVYLVSYLVCVLSRGD